MKERAIKDQSKIILMLASVANAAFGISLQFACILVLGAGPVTDAYFLAQTVPLIASGILAAAVTNNLTPMAAGLDGVRRTALVRDLMFKFALLASILFGTLAGTSQWWVPTLFFGLAEDFGLLATDLSRAFCAIAVVQVLTAIGAAGHYACRRFVFVELVHAGTTLLALLAAAPVIEASGILGFAWLLLVRATIALMIVNCGFLSSNQEPVHELTAILLKRTRDLMSASVIFKTGPIIDRMLASFTAPGMLTSLGIGQQVVGSSLAITERVMTRPLMVAAGEYLGSVNHKNIIDLYYQQLRILMFVTIIALSIAAPIGIFAMQDDKIFGLFDLASFGQLDVFFLVLLTIIPAAAGQLSASLMYAIGDVKSINRLAMISFLLSTTLKISGFLLFGAYAIVAGIFLYQTLNWLLLHTAAMRALHPSNVKWQA
jgi:peptidoglycan biosynthesis protein MviN/MurJ (putative lipid II flippase)